MAGIAGYGGSVTCTNMTVGVRAWTLDDAVDELDSTTYADAGIAQWPPSWASR